MVHNFCSQLLLTLLFATFYHHFCSQLVFKKSCVHQFCSQAPYFKQGRLFLPVGQWTLFLLFLWLGKTMLTLFEPTLSDSSHEPGGGADLSPLNYSHRISFSLLFRDKVLAFNENGEHLNSQPSTLETVAMKFINQKWCFWQKSEKNSKLAI